MRFLLLLRTRKRKKKAAKKDVPEDNGDLEEHIASLEAAKKGTKPAIDGAKPKQLRVNAHNIALTYSQIGDVTKKEIYDFVTNLKDSKYCIVAMENHKDGGKHIHVYISYYERVNSVSGRFFDYNGLHPFIKAARTPAGWIRYIKKEDKGVIEEVELNVYEAKGCTKLVQDVDTFRSIIQDKKKRAWPSEEIMLPVVNKLHRIVGSKKRHVLVVSPPDFGKSDWVETYWRGFKIFKPAPKEKTGAHYPFDDYMNENVIIYDDHFPSRNNIISITQVYYSKTRIAGNTRYGCKHWLEGQERFCIILANVLPCYHKEDWFTARFNVFDCRTESAKKRDKRRKRISSPDIIIEDIYNSESDNDFDNNSVPDSSLYYRTLADLDQ